MRNTIKQFSRIALAACLLFVVACDSLDDHYEDLNINPTQANQIDPNFKLTDIQLRISGERYENWRTNLIYSSTMMQHIAALPGYWSGDKYSYNAGYSSAMWDRYYPNIARNIEDLLVQTCADPEDANMCAITEITRVLMYHRLTDLYGDIPYSEAGKGFTEGITQPKYDRQSDIYADMLARLESAVNSLDASKASFGAGDLLYAGDVAKWKKFGNSLMLRLGMRLVKVDPGAAQSWAQKAVSGGVMTSNEDIAMINHNDPAGWRNGIGSVFQADGNPRLSKTFVDWMVNTGDPRLDIIGLRPAGADAVGLPNGRVTGATDATFGIENDPSWVDCDSGADPCGMDVYMRVNPMLVAETDPMLFMTYAEVELLMAEAAQRGYISGSDANHYQNGVRAAMNQLVLYDANAGIAGADIDAYLAANPYNGSLEQINNQIWGATFLNEYEAFANWRRSGFPALTPINFPGNESNGQIPRRLRYPTGESVANAANYEAAVSAQGPDEFTTRVWWDAN
ncbi:MAG: SusD/RagB family nutrient-binding outer membrane lipoprotein [Rhodothermales bacterium]